MREQRDLRFLGHLLTANTATETVRMFSEEIFAAEVHRQIFRRIAAHGADAALFELAGHPEIGRAIRLALAYPPGHAVPWE